MAVYDITAPNGSKYRVTAPEGASQDEVLSRVKAQSVADDMSNMSVGQVASQALKNAPESAIEFAKNTVQPIIHPIDTLHSLGSLWAGALEKVDRLGDTVKTAKRSVPGIGAIEDVIGLAKKAGLIEEGGNEKYLNAVGQFMLDRYGSVDAVKKTIAKDPVGVLADLSVVLSLGGGAAERAPGLIGQVGRVVSGAGRTIDPINAAAKGLKLAGSGAAEALGVTTGVGSEAIKTAARAGAKGGEAGAAFRSGLRGTEDMSAVVDEAKAAVGQLRQERGEAYRAAMADIGADQSILDFGGIDRAIAKVEGVQKYKGQDLSPSTAAVREQITAAVDEWRHLPAGDFHTPEGLDALKKKIGDIRDGTQYGSPERVVADGIYRAIRKTIVDQAPEYGKAMKAYEEASDLIREIESTLSTKPNANIDTTLRKLQSVLRDNVSTNYGRRRELVDYLSKAGAPHLLEKLAGQTLSSATPRGLARAIAGGEGFAALGAALSGNPLVALGLGGGLAATSPALVGAAAHGAGAVSRLPLRTLGRSAFQVGRLPPN